MNKPFSLEEFKAGKKAVTRCGEIATFGGYNPDAIPTFEMIGWVGNTFWGWTKEGASHKVGENYKDLISMAPEKKTVWVNVYRRDEDGWLTSDEELYPTKDKAVGKHGCNVGWSYVGTFPLEIEV